MRGRLALLAALMGLAGSAHAAGLFLAPRGVRPLARGGAYVAGASDANAMSYNPAALTLAGPGVLIDAALALSSTDYSRRVYADSEPMPAVRGVGLMLPLPTLAAVHDFGLADGLVFGFSVAADYPALQNWPSEVDGGPAPQRYAIENYDGTAISKIAAGAAYRVGSALSLGLAGQLLVGNFASQQTASACDGVICTPPESPLFDTRIQIISRNIVAPGLHAGLLLEPASWLRIGAAWESGFTIDNDAELRIRLPSDDAYVNAYLDPSEPDAKVRFRLPWEARFGVEVRDADALQVEAAFVWTHWSAHDSIELDPGETAIRDIFQIGAYELDTIVVERGFEDTWSARLGGEYAPLLGGERPLALRAGLMYEPSAIPDETLTPLTADLDKLLVSLGVGYKAGDVVFDATIAHVFMQERDVSTSRAMQTSPLRPPYAGRTPIGNGLYQGRATLFGFGARLVL